MKRLIPLFLTVLFAISCNDKSNSPSSPGTNLGGGSGGNNGGGAGNAVLTSPMLEAALVDNLLATAATATIGASVNIASPSGPVTNASVTLSGPVVGAIPVAYTNSTLSLPVSANGGVSMVSFGAYNTVGWTYLPSQPYTVTASFGGTIYSDSITAVGAVTIQIAGLDSPVTCSWANPYSTSSSNPLNISQFTATNISGTTVFSDPSPLQAPFLSSPVTIPAASLTDAVDVALTTGTIITSAFPGSYSGSFIESSSEAQTTY